MFFTLSAGATVLFAYLIKQPVKKKLQLQSEIEGFKMYMGR